MDALAVALKGSALEVMIGSDNETLRVRPRLDTLDGKGREKKLVGGINGRVLDSASGNAVVGATVVVVGTALSGVSNAKGEFEIKNVPVGNQTISFKALGFKTLGRSVNVVESRGVEIDVRMVASATALSEVVTTATGRQRRVEVPSDIVKIDAEEIKERTPVRTVTDMLEAAQVPGVLVQRGSGEPGSPTRIRMRGIGSISQSNDPVIIVDGVWIDNKSDNQGARGIDAIDPESIETIEIVRGPSAATMYGMDASNGVIVITTKKGRPGTTRWEFGYGYDWGQISGKKPVRYFGIGRPNPELDSLVTINCPALSQVISGVSVMNGTCFQDSVSIYDPNHPLLNNEAVETNHRMNFSVSGGTEKLLYSLMFSSQDQIGARREQPIKFVRLRKMGANSLYDESDFERPVTLDRRDITTNFTVRPQENLDVSVVVAASQGKQGRDSLWFRRLAGLPDIGEAQPLSLDTVVFLSAAQDHLIEPYREKLHTSGIRLNSSINWMPGLGLRFSGNLGLDHGINDRSTNSNRIYCSNDLSCRDSMNSGGSVVRRMERNSYSSRLSGSTILNLGRLSRLLQLQPSIGGDFRRTENSSIATSGLYNRLTSVSAGWYINSTIRILQRLYFDLGIRQDLGSAITTTSRTGGLPFLGLPKLGSSWLMSDESFWPENNIVSLFRIRGAIGYAAVQPEITDILGVYKDRDIYTDSSRFIRGVLLSSAPNRMLVPEKAGEIELGFDSEMFSEKVYLIVTYAHKENRNAIVTRALAPSSGLGSASRKQNIARVVNKNFELAATARLIENKIVQLQTNYNLTLSENKVAELGSRITPFNAESGRIAEGYPIASQWSKVVLDYRDANEDGVISRDEVVISDSLVYRGWSQPRHRSSFGVSLGFNNVVTFDSRFSYQGRYSQSYTFNGYRGREDITSPLLIQAMYQARFRGDGNMEGTQTVSDFRWNSASVTFHLPYSFAQRLNSRSLQLRLQGSNLALWSNYSGRDPGVNSSLLGSSSGDLLQDNGGTMPRPRLFVVELRWGI